MDSESVPSFWWDVPQQESPPPPSEILLQEYHQFMGGNGFHGRSNHLPRISHCNSCSFCAIIDGNNPAQNFDFGGKVSKTSGYRFLAEPSLRLA